MTPNQQNSPGKPPIIFARTVTAQMARVSLEFLGRLEAEDLMQPHTPEGREPGYTPEDIHRLTLIRRLHETLGWTWPPSKWYSTSESRCLRR